MSERGQPARDAVIEEQMKVQGDVKCEIAVRDFSCKTCKAPPGEFCVGFDEPPIRRTHLNRTFKVTDKAWVAEAERKRLSL